MSCEQLISALQDPHAYEVELDAKKYTVEVELLKNTRKYINVALSVDDGSLPASISPLTHNFIRQKTPPLFSGRTAPR